MTARVSSYSGSTPVLILAPHSDDAGTGDIARSIINNLDCYGVINNGWIKSSSYDYDSEHADCNNIEHIHNDVIKSEFLVPILRFQKRIIKKNPIMYMFTIRGAKMEARKEADDQTLDLIIGFGAGNPPAYTCDLWRKNLFSHLIGKCGLTIYEAASRSKYAARNKNNLTQLFNMNCWYPDKRTQAMQLSVIEDLRTEDDAAEYTGEFIADIIKELIQWSSWSEPIGFNTKKI